jgi:hypothetical protein
VGHTAAAGLTQSHWRARPAGVDKGDVIMTIHAPAHPGGVVSPRVHDNTLGWMAATAAILLLVIGAVLVVPAIMSDQPTSMSAQQQSLIEYRAYERLDLAAGRAYPEWKALLEFRAAERTGR